MYNPNGLEQIWYYLEGGLSKGPVTATYLNGMIASGAVASTTLVSQAGWPQWSAAWQVFSPPAPAAPVAGAAAPPPPTFITGQPGAIPFPVMPAAPPHSGNVLASLMQRIDKLAGTEKLEGFNLKDMFSEVFKSRTREELDDHFIVGTYRTTPRIQDVQTGWPKPWFFGRVLLFVGLMYVAFSIAMTQFQNENLIPGLMMMGSLAVPLATVFLFFELNTPKNVSFAQVLMLVCVGGIVSMSVSLIGFNVSALSWLGASQAGIIEEIGKVLAVFLICREQRYKYILNGLLFGAAVGAGFAAFESAGYAFRFLLQTHSLETMNSVIHLRALLTPFGHVAWTAISAGALWRVKGDQKISLAMLVNPKFLTALIIPIVLHMVWDSPLQVPFYAVQLTIGVVGWYVVFGLVQQGLRQVKTEQTDALHEELSQTQTRMRMTATA
jgi:RsiW-degrading membrane proteinase PrsW (M82 family)